MIYKVIKEFPNLQGWRVGSLFSARDPVDLLSKGLVVPVMIMEATIIDAEIVPEEMSKKVESKTKTEQKGVKINAESKNNKII